MSVVHGRAMTIVEVLVALVLLSMMLGGVLSAVELSARTQHGTADRVLARSLAADLLDEVCSMPYEDDVYGEFGIGVDEDPGDRSTFDDVDDYHGWLRNPPEFRDGSPIPGTDGWQRRVFVRLVDPANPNAILGVESGGKLVIVRVSRGGVVYSEMARLRTRSWNPSTTGD